MNPFLYARSTPTTRIDAFGLEPGLGPLFDSETRKRLGMRDPRQDLQVVIDWMDEKHPDLVPEGGANTAFCPLPGAMTGATFCLPYGPCFLILIDPSYADLPDLADTVSHEYGHYRQSPEERELMRQQDEAAEHGIGPIHEQIYRDEVGGRFREDVRK